jgi:hypothetical protein
MFHDFFPFDQFERIKFLPEKPSNGAASYQIGIIFKSIDFDTEIKDPRGVLELPQEMNHLLDQPDILHENTRQLPAFDDDLFRAIQAHARGRSFRQVQDIIQTDQKPVNVIPVNRGNKGFVEARQGLVDDFVRLMLYGSDPLSALITADSPSFDHFTQNLDPLDNVCRNLVKDVKKNLVSWDYRFEHKNSSGSEVITSLYDDGFISFLISRKAMMLFGRNYKVGK